MDLVHQDGERLFVTSLDISNRFGKQHKDVLRAIRELDCSPEFNRRNFALVEYQDGKGEKRPSYQLTRDGFGFLCMGFTGQQAALWKERYIEAFNQMETALRQPAALPSAESRASLELMTALSSNLAREVGTLKDSLIATQQAMLGLYERLDISHGKHIRALSTLSRQQAAQAKRESVEAVIRLEAEGVPREEIARLTGKTLNCVRQHVFRARADGRLPPLAGEQGDLDLGGAA